MRTHLDIRHEGSLGSSDRHRMEFDPDSIAHLMSVLTDLYSDPALAVIREYSTNALDSHIAAGNPDPIKVYAPNALNPTFRVVDNGVGLSVEEIVNNFSKYGWSSKRDNDEEVGMLGLGCKSALAYTSQFTLIAIKNGIRAMVLVTRDSDGCGAIQVVDTAATDEPNGVEVQVPVPSRTTSFTETLYEFFRVWEPGTVLVNDEELTDHYGTQPEDLVLDPDVILSSRLPGDVIVMGNVPYPCPDRLDNHEWFQLVKSTNNYRFQETHAMVRVPIGTINFSPSRESLTLTKRTIETLYDAQTFIARTQEHKAQQEIDACKTPSEAWELAKRWRDSIGGSYTYKFQNIPSQFTVDPERTFSWVVNSTWAREKAYRHTKSQITASDLKGHHVIVGFDKKALSPGARDKITHYFQTVLANTQRKTIYVTAHSIGEPWTDGLFEKLLWSDIEQVKLPDDGTAKKKRTVPKYRIVNGAGGGTERELEDDETVVWMKAGDDVVYRSRYYEACKTLANPDETVTLVLLHSTRIGKFVRDNPDALYVQSFIAGRAKKVTWTDIQAFGIWSSSQRDYSAQDYWRNLRNFGSGLTGIADRFLDPELRAALEIVSNQEIDAASRRRQVIDSALTSLRIRGAVVKPITTKTHPAVIDMKNKIMAAGKMYPLLAGNSAASYRRQEKDHWVQYANAMYLATTQLKLNLGG